MSSWKLKFQRIKTKQNTVSEALSRTLIWQKSSDDDVTASVPDSELYEEVNHQFCCFDGKFAPNIKKKISQQLTRHEVRQLYVFSWSLLPQ